MFEECKNRKKTLVVTICNEKKQERERQESGERRAHKTLWHQAKTVMRPHIFHFNTQIREKRFLSNSPKRATNLRQG
ncbi:hypothetical protein HMPREF0658_1513 [Hoylesella marshii DSM 16973 = JCM 13450]|uniref:Uncharacterized protein n=1 Tax=Hoylesella marshii DSM 16973 = JCM 13450 TaxID=862515 RepID=E0NTL1_9BACT|nr:hypothetical protein HMPREF0658_1513 [Hoylesella marshii DSM 16973 = JCM 13450]